MRRFPSGSQPNTPPDPKRYSDEVWTDVLAEGAEPSRINVARVAFAPGARTAWHTHPFGQILLVLSGAGLVQKAGSQPYYCVPGCGGDWAR